MIEPRNRIGTPACDLSGFQPLNLGGEQGLNRGVSEQRTEDGFRRQLLSRRQGGSLSLIFWVRHCVP